MQIDAEQKIKDATVTIKAVVLVLRAIELVLTDVSVALSGKEPSDLELKKEVEDYLEQAREELERGE